MAVETEIKLPVADLTTIKRQLRRLGWRVRKRRTLERNWVFDRKDDSLRRGGRLLRVRRVGSTAWLTVKGPSASGTPHKVRDEFEIETADADAVMKILETLDYRVSWRYEKYRSEFAKPSERGKILVDETPVGDFLELEGSGRWIDETAELLGFQRTDYVMLSYRGLFEKFRRGHRIGPDMVFEK